VLKIQALSSGSRGNVIYVASETTHILIDVGLNPTQLKRRCAAAGLDMTKIDAVLVTHEHADHIIGLGAFLESFDSTLYLHTGVADIFANLPSGCIQLFNDSFQIGDIMVNYFPVPHDSQFCFGYSFSKGDMKISLATDIGRVTSEIIQNMANSQIVMIECNHCLTKLSHNRKYPHFLKRRITSSRGHLSNPACALAVYELSQLGVSQFILGHISHDNNSPTLAYSSVKDFLESRGIIEGQDVWIDVATQDKPSIPYTCTLQSQ